MNIGMVDTPKVVVPVPVVTSVTFDGNNDWHLLSNLAVNCGTFGIERQKLVGNPENNRIYCAYRTVLCILQVRLLSDSHLL